MKRGNSVKSPHYAWIGHGKETEFGPSLIHMYNDLMAHLPEKCLKLVLKNIVL